MFSLISQMLSYPFISRALIVGLLVSLCAALLGVPLVLKRYSMIGDGLSHIGFGTMACAIALNLAPLAVAIPVMILVSFLLLRMSESTKIKGDAAIAMMSSSALAIGVVVSAFSSGGNIDIEGYLFGSIYAISDSDLLISVPMTLILLVLFSLFYNRIFSVTFDENFSAATGTRVSRYNALLALLIAVTIVIGMRMLGTLLISSLIIFPALSAMRVCRSFRGVICYAAVVSVLCFLLGMLISFPYPVPTGACIVLVNVAAFIISFIIGKIKNRV